MPWKFVSYNVRISGEFDSKKDSNSIKLKEIPWILVMCVIQIYLVYILLIIWPFNCIAKRQKSERYAVSSRHTNSWTNFCNPHLELICCSKGHLGTLEISTLPNIAAGTHFHSQNGTKPTTVFSPADRVAPWSLLQSLVSFYQVVQCNHKTPFLVSSRQ